MSTTYEHYGTVVLRYSGPHQTQLYRAGTGLQVLAPIAAITVEDGRAAHALLEAWVRAEPLARRVFVDAPSGAYLTPGTASLLCSVHLNGPQSRHTPRARAAHLSPLGAGQVILRIGVMTVIMDHRQAWVAQWDTWCEVYEQAHQLWPLALPLTLDDAVAELRSRYRSR
jgi:hypothetical protein